MEAIHFSKIPLAILFYNPNIYPRSEYDLRKKDVMAFAAKLDIPFIDLDYDNELWGQKTRGLEMEPERGRRCELCFNIRLRKTAEYAFQNGFKIFATSLGISRWKNLAQVNTCGLSVAALYPGLTFWNYNWRKQGGSNRKDKIAKRENFYRQNYCGCYFSLEQTVINSQSRLKMNGVKI